MDGEQNNFIDGYAQIGDVRLHYVKAGAGERLIVLLHGFPEFWYSWRSQLEALSGRFTVVAPDLRGYNLSDKPANIADYRLDKIIDDITGLIRHLGFEQAAIVGHDWGAVVAWRLAYQHPEYVWRLAAMQVPPPEVWRKNMSFKQFLASWYMLFFQIPVLPELLMKINDFALLERTMKSSAAQGWVFTNEVIEQYKKSWREDNALTAMVNYYRANLPLVPKDKSETTYEKIKAPTLFIYGERDTAILPATVKNVQDAIEAKFVEVRIFNAGHWVQQEAADEVNDALLEFFAED
jgi:epoxide hydrolase 4